MANLIRTSRVGAPMAMSIQIKTKSEAPAMIKISGIGIHLMFTAAAVIVSATTS
jgi:hypothetical protein